MKRPCPRIILDATKGMKYSRFICKVKSAKWVLLLTKNNRTKNSFN